MPSVEMLFSNKIIITNDSIQLKNHINNHITTQNVSSNSSLPDSAFILV
jgi:hypothetical protein